MLRHRTTAYRQERAAVLARLADVVRLVADAPAHDLSDDFGDDFGDNFGDDFGDDVSDDVAELLVELSDEFSDEFSDERPAERTERDLEPVSPPTAPAEPASSATGERCGTTQDGGGVVRVTGVVLLDRLTPTFASQRGLVTRAQFIEAGGTGRRLQSWGDRHILRCVLPNVWMLNGVPITSETRLLGHCLASGGVASHRAAARLLGLRDFADAGREITVPRERNYRTKALDVHQSQDLDRITPITIDGIPCTPPERTLLDLGQVLPWEVVEEAADEMLRLDLVGWESIVDCWAQHARRGRPGIKLLGALIDARRGERDQPDSRPERHMMRVLIGGGIFDGVLHHSIHDADGNFVLEGDISWPPNKVVLFYDSKEHHDRPEERLRDDAKRREAALLGWTVLPYRAKVLYRTPWVIVREVREALGRPAPDGPAS